MTFNPNAPWVPDESASIPGPQVPQGQYEADYTTDGMFKLSSDGQFVQSVWPVAAPKGNFGLAIIGTSNGYRGPHPGILQPVSDFSGDWSLAGNANGTASWGYTLSRSALPLLANYCVSGSTIVEQAAQMVKLRLIKASHVLTFISSNDIYGATTFYTLWTTFRGWLNEILGWGGTPIIVIPFARATTTAAQVTKLLKFKAAILDFCARQVVPCYYLDALGIVAQVGSSTLVPKTGYLDTDNIHLSSRGAMATGIALADILTKCAPVRPDTFPLVGYDVDPTGDELVSNPQLAGTNGSLPTSWTAPITGGGAAVYSNQLRPNGHNALRISFTATAAGDSIQFQQGSVPGRVPAGSWATAGIKVTVVSGGQYLRVLQPYMGISTGDAQKVQGLQPAAASANQSAHDLLDGKAFWVDMGRFQKVDSVGSRFGVVLTAFAAGTFVVELEAPYCRLSADGWPR